jgi:GNAT superfamily N-acetyltransferase
VNTDQPISDFSPAAVSHAIADNLYSVFVHHIALMSGGEILSVGETIGYFSGIPFPLFNGTVRPRFPVAKVGEAIDAFIAHARSRQVPMLWHLTPGSEPEDLGERLEARGFQFLDLVPGMAVDLARLPAADLPSDLSIERVRGLDSLRLFSSVLCKAFGMPSWLEDPWVQLLGSAGFDDNASLLHYVARLDGELVAVSSVAYAAGVAGIYSVGTLEAYRGRGIGRAMTLAPLLDARDRGYRVGILNSSEIGLSIYRRLGFEQCCEIQQYLWRADSSPDEATA